MDFGHVHKKYFKNTKLLRRQTSIHCSINFTSTKEKTYFRYYSMGGKMAIPARLKG